MARTPQHELDELESVSVTGDVGPVAGSSVTQPGQGLVLLCPRDAYLPGQEPVSLLRLWGGEVSS